MPDLLEDDSTEGSARRLLDDPGPLGLAVQAWAVASCQGRQRHRNEDGWAQAGAVFAVTDGMGGLADGHIVSAAAARLVVETWLRHDGDDVVRGDRAIRFANNQLIANGIAAASTSGCTVVAARITRDHAIVVHAGDSRVYRLREGHGELLTVDHNLRSELLAAGIVPRSGDSWGPQRALTSHLGLPDEALRVDVRSVALQHGDRLVLCTDGVFNELSHAEFTARVVGGTPETAADRLTAQGSRDDATALVLDVGHEDGPLGGGHP